MLQLASIEKQFTTNMEKWAIYRKLAGANKANLQGNHRNPSTTHRMMQQKPLNITSPRKATPWCVSVDTMEITVLMQLDIRASKFPMSESIFKELWLERNLSPS